VIVGCGRVGSGDGSIHAENFLSPEKRNRCSGNSIQGFLK